MEPPTFLSTIFHHLFDLMKKSMASGAVSDYSMPIDLTKKFKASDAVSDFIHKLSDLIKKFLASGIHKLSDLTDTFLASDTVIYVLQWFKKQNIPTMVAVVVIVLLFCSCCGCLAKGVCSCCGCLAKGVRSCCGCLAKIVRICSGCLAKSVKTMKAPGRNYRIPRSNFEANPRAYFRDLRKG